jgi:hypothetical protein
MTTTLQEQWFKTAVGRAINPDRAYGLQCVDVADDYAMAIFPGKSWQETIGGVGGAREFAGRNNRYFKWIANIPGNLANIPQRGDLIVYDGVPANPYGHVAVVLSATAQTATVVQQDGFLQNAAHVATLPYWGPGTGACSGWLRPLVSEPAKAANIRTTGPLGVKERTLPSTTGKQLRVFGPNLDLTMKGYWNGERVGGNNLWYVGISGNYFHSLGFTKVSAAGLPNLTVVPKPKPATTVPVLTATQRFAGPDGASVRKTPDKNGVRVDIVVSGSIINLKGYVVAADPFGGQNPRWLVTTSGNYVWSGAVVGASVGTLPDLTPKPAPTPAPGYAFTTPWKTVTKVVPADLSNFQLGNFPDKPVFAVIHQMDDPDRHPTLAGTANWFQTARPAAPSSAHFGAQDGELWAFVDTVDRAFAAGAVGNNYIHIEVPPNPSAATIETVKAFLREWKATKHYELQLIRHMDVPGNNTLCGTYIPLEAFSIATTPGGDMGAVTNSTEALDLLTRVTEWLKSKV